MVEVAAHPPGSFCFIEAGSVDLESSNRFYEGLFGWEVDGRSLPDGGKYTRFLIRGKPVAGMYAVGAEQDVTAVPSQWLSYVSVEDAVATLERAIGLGATPFGDVIEVHGVVTVAEFVDPEGAVCGLWQPGTHIGASYMGEPGTLAWNDLLTPDPTEAASFYCNVFHWTSDFQELPSGTYHFLRSGKTFRAGMTTMRPEMGEVSPSWRTCIGVSDIEYAMTRLTDLGGCVGDEAIPVAGLGRRVAVKDPIGVNFTLIETAPHLKIRGA